MNFSALLRDSKALSFSNMHKNARSNLDFEKHLLTFQDEVGSSGWHKDFETKTAVEGEMATMGFANARCCFFFNG